MPETIDNKKVFSLLEVALSLEKTIEDRYTSSFWVKAEMSKLNHYPKSGHCYPDLVEKQDGKVIAQMRANLWKNDYLNVNNNFLKVLKEPLKDGIKIMFLARISFDPVYGLTLQIIDIDPSYTLGDLEMERRETIKELKEEGIFEKNKKLPMPLLPQRIAIISVESSKGYKDFLGKIDNNSWKYKFFHVLFPSILQGEKIIKSISEQLERIRKVSSHFDVVAIIRGGGGDIGLSSYNNYELAREIALFPLPVLTGIGHITNQTVVEMIAYDNLITPTDLADYLIQKFHNFSVPVQKAEEKITTEARQIITNEKNEFQSLAKLFRSVSRNVIIGNKGLVEELQGDLLQHLRFVITNRKEELSVVNVAIKNSGQKMLLDAGKSVRALATSMKKDTGAMLEKFKIFLSHQSMQIRKDSTRYINEGNNSVMQVRRSMADKCRIHIKSNGQLLAGIEKNILILDPKNVLKRGYSITLVDGAVVKSAAQVREGDQLKTMVYEGEIISNVKSINKT